MIKSISKRVTGILILLASAGAINAQIWTNSETLKRMLTDAEQRGLRLQGKERLALDRLCPGIEMWINYRDTLLVDMGIRLFPKEMRQDYLPEIYPFLERYTLALLLRPDPQAQIRQLQADGVRLQIGGIRFEEGKWPFSTVLQKIASHPDFTLRTDSNYIEAAWGKRDADRVAFLIPKQYDLILGQDKMELTHCFREKLVAFHPVLEQSETDRTDTLAADTEADFDFGGYYWLEQVTKGVYRRKDNQKYLFDIRRKRESLSNLFSSAHEMGKRHKLRLTILGYRYKESFIYPLDRLCAFMRQNKCLPYIGMEQEDARACTGSVFYVNHALMYKHLLYFHFPLRAFQQEDVLIDATIYPYIPINNIKTLYDKE